MEPVNFPESNHIFKKPDGLTEEQCGSVHALLGIDQKGVPVTITCWKLSRDEIDTIIETGIIWSYHWGHALQPNALGVKNPFRDNNDTSS